MSLVCRLASSSGRIVKQHLTPRLLTQSLTRSIKTGGDGKKAGHERDEINPADPHTGQGAFADIHLGPGIVSPPKGPKTVEEFAHPSGHWITYGFDYTDKTNDRFEAHFCFLILITGVLYGMSALFWYFPDIKMDNWITREAYLEMDRRKKLGGPYITRDYVPPHLIVLPTDEELGDMEIII